jgi:hypothetical protein
MYSLTGLEDHFCVETIEHASNSTQMIRMRVRNDHYRKLPHALAGEKRNYDPTTGISVATAWPGIDQHPAPAWRSNDGAVALTHIEKM